MGAQVWAEMADGSCRWRQTGSEIKVIALKARTRPSACTWPPIPQLDPHAQGTRVPDRAGKAPTVHGRTGDRTCVQGCEAALLGRAGAR